MASLRLADLYGHGPAAETPAKRGKDDAKIQNGFCRSFDSRRHRRRRCFGLRLREDILEFLLILYNSMCMPDLRSSQRHVAAQIIPPNIEKGSQLNGSFFRAKKKGSLRAGPSFLLTAAL